KEAVPQWKIPFIDTTIKVDGLLNEAAYQQAFHWNQFVQTDPGDNTAPSRKTEISLFCTKKALVIGVRCFDPHPKEIRRTRYRRDQIYGSESIEIMLDTFGNGKQMYFVDVTPMNDVGDGVYDVSNGGNMDYDMVFQHAARITKDGWIAEIRIPFSSLSFGKNGSGNNWLFSLNRYIPRTDTETDSMLPIDRNSNDPKDGMAYLSLEINPGKGKKTKRWKFIPSLVVSGLNHRDDFSGEAVTRTSKRGDLGMTIEYSPSPHTKWKAALHPDFSQVEADDTYQRINNRYPIFFPEKRPFFMDGMESFKTPFMLLHTRTIVKPQYGMKFSTKQGRLGLFGISALEQNVPGERFGEGNITRDTLWNIFRATWTTDNRGSFIGGMVTQRNFGGDYNRVVSIDGVQRMKKLTLTYQGVVSTTTEADTKDSGNGLGLNLHYKWNQYIDSSVGFSQLSPDFRDDAGFFRRVGFRTYYIGQSYSYSPKTDRSFIKRFFANIWYSVSYNYDSVMINQGPSCSFFANFPGSIQFTGTYSSDNEEYNGRVYDTNFIYFNILWAENPGFQPWLSSQSGQSILYGDNPKLVNMKSFGGGVTSQWGAFSLDVSSNYYTYRDRVTDKLERRQASVETVLTYVLNDRINIKLFHISDIALMKDYDFNEPYHYFNLLFTWQKNAFSKVYIGITNGHDTYRDASLAPINFQQDKQIFAKITWLF
ncbi:MAG: carbohydrate binding family 9 domain-containing protein, partial [Acidobacteria bacterium]|nr:carbohydrate binding family 9 domain-containing protein [Acidobacteriota bacterium]